MHICLKSYLNYFEQRTQQGNSGGVKISERLKIGRYNVGPGYNEGKSEKDKQDNNDYNNNNKKDNNYNNNNNGGKDGDIEKDNNKNKWEGGDKGVRL